MEIGVPLISYNFVFIKCLYLLDYAVHPVHPPFGLPSLLVHSVMLVHG